MFSTLSKQSSDDEDCSAKGRNRHIVINKAELANSMEVLESFKLARESWELLCSLEFLDKGKNMLVALVLFNFSYKIILLKNILFEMSSYLWLIKLITIVHTHFRILLSKIAHQLFIFKYPFTS